ncbi:MAG: Fe-S cluster assembly protein IscX [Chloroflexi bacterium]|nr:Fe-S cluster assembly protein IscX [Chloroflexota bacterium]
MSDPIYWDDAYPIALLLRRTRPGVNLLDVPLDRLCEWVKQLDGFADESDVFPVDCLEQIQAEWVELSR